MSNLRAPITDEEVERIALERHRNQRLKCYEFFGNEDDGCYCIVNTRTALEAFLRERFEADG